MSWWEWRGWRIQIVMSVSSVYVEWMRVNFFFFCIYLFCLSKLLFESEEWAVWLKRRMKVCGWRKEWSVWASGRTRGCEAPLQKRIMAQVKDRGVREEWKERANWSASWPKWRGRGFENERSRCKQQIIFLFLSKV